MSYECQIIGEDNCGIGKECTNNNCDYRICDSCALNILKHSDHDNIFCKFNCPACQRPILFNFNKRILFFYYFVYFKNYMKKLFLNHFIPFFGVSSLIWTCLCIGRIFIILLNHSGFMIGMNNDFFFDEFLIKSVIGWIILCFLGIALFLISYVIISFFATIYICFQMIKNCYNNEFIEILQNP